jgi:hypothetical protein
MTGEIIKQQGVLVTLCTAEIATLEKKIERLERENAFLTTRTFS